MARAPTAPIKILIVDDSPLMRQILTEMLSQEDDMRVVGTAADPLVARELIKQLNPDVMTLDIEMPRMDGLAFLEKVMTLRPMPVVMVSTLTEAGAEATLQALDWVPWISSPNPKACCATAWSATARNWWPKCGQLPVRGCARSRTGRPR
jgi:two-component system chemotaxis response regulator CheB